MDQRSVRAVVATAVERLFASQPDIFRLTAEECSDGMEPDPQSGIGGASLAGG